MEFDELNAVFGEGLASDWTSTAQFTDDAWSGDGNASYLLPSTTGPGGTLLQAWNFHVDQNGEPNGVNLPIDELSFDNTEIPLPDVLWPSFIDAPFDPDLWNASLAPNQSSILPLPPDTVVSAIASTDALEDGGSSDNSRKRRKRIPTDAKKLLEDCFERHRDDPYVPQHEISELIAQTGLSARQVRTFFANARARKLPRAPGSQSRNRTKPLDIPASTTMQPDPMTRFLSISPEEEGLSEAAVRKAAESTNHPAAPSAWPRQTSFTDALSVSEGADSSQSGGSSSSIASLDSANMRGPRRGRKRQRERTQQASDSMLRRPSNPLKKFQCTFCPTDFAQKYDWRRHEESVHFPQKEWVCMPDGPTWYHGANDDEGEPRCVFCEQHAPDEEHLQTHNSAACITAPRPQRTFLRKDKLIQHLTQVHICHRPPPAITDWCRPIERSVTLICGFCAAVLPDWAARADHIAQHFGNGGVGMDMWVLGEPGGVVPNGNGVSAAETAARKYGAEEDKDGKIHCGACASRFASLAAAVMHQRKVHDTYASRDKFFIHFSDASLDFASTSLSAFKTLLHTRLGLPLPVPVPGQSNTTTAFDTMVTMRLEMLRRIESAEKVVVTGDATGRVKVCSAGSGDGDMLMTDEADPLSYDIDDASTWTPITSSSIPASASVPASSSYPGIRFPRRAIDTAQQQSSSNISPAQETPGPTTPYSPISRVASGRSLVSNPHADWSRVMAQPNSNSPSPIQSRHFEQALRLRRNGSSGLAPAQGMLHSLEQMAASADAAPWPDANAAVLLQHNQQQHQQQEQQPEQDPLSTNRLAARRTTRLSNMHVPPPEAIAWPDPSEPFGKPVKDRSGRPLGPCMLFGRGATTQGLSAGRVAAATLDARATWSSESAEGVDRLR
ncbi:hypothetical protein BDV95DRAFT_12927 [Massariosphaeria phaeospora]|uniref:Homeobox domain-containing protein n=1 Tax=Massariosphaeria phaeospora TaxID=100035 RepID=A0A7C8MK25_9PLEO|nr:hypothetical protein BDV95DRAFT_12927 [Massariosphaeria phaeospora]